MGTVPWYHGYHGTMPPRYTDHPVLRWSVPAPRTPRCRRDPTAPWAQGLLFPRVRARNNVTSVTLLLRARSFSPGHPDRLRPIRGKCWIATRSDLAGSGQGQRAWPGHPSDPRARGSEVYPSLPRIRTSRTRKSRISDQTNWRVFWPFYGKRQNPENRLFLAFPGSGPHSNQRDGQIRTWPDLATFRPFGDMWPKPAFLGFWTKLIRGVG